MGFGFDLKCWVGLRLVETFGGGLSEKLSDMLGERFGEMLDLNRLQVSFKQA